MTEIRNILQSVQGREIIKSSPDMIVYIEGVPYFKNDYLKGPSTNYVIVNFNDYVTAISCNYGVDNLMPSGSVNLSIPNGSKSLFLAPGGGFMLQPMSELRIYAKNYYFAKNGNTIYRRVFNGMIRSIDYNETNTSMEVAISIVGNMRWLELMQVDIHPAFLSFSSAGQRATKTIDSYLTPYEMLANVLWRAMDFSGFLKSGFEESLKLYGVQKDFITNWQARLESLKKYIHVFGWTKPITVPTDDLLYDPVNPWAIEGQRKLSNTSPEDAAKDINVAYINKHLPEMSIGTLNLIDSSGITSRLERFKQIIETMGYEGYQDLDGNIVVKPPAYNLDCTVIGDTSKIPNENLTPTTNPYIINLSEILGENYMEDETGIRRTRMTVKGSFYPEGLGINIDKFQSIGSFTDVNLLRKFGIRDESVKTISFLGNNASVLTAFAAMELAKANKNAKVYHVTIPMRPELRLGFPIFIPHLDMYAYITAISLSYNVGGRADMSLTCNYIRKRPQKGVPQKINNVDSIVYTSQPNLVHAFVYGAPSSSTTTLASTTPPSPQSTVSNTQPIGPGTSDTLPSPIPPTASDNIINTYIKTRSKTIFETMPDSPTSNWRIQNDPGIFDGKMNPVTQLKTLVPQDKNLLDIIRTYQPYTDEKGYEVISPFAWGRYTPLAEAIFDFTTNTSNNLDLRTQAPVKVVQNASAFVYAGLAIPINGGSSSALNDVMNQELVAFDQSNVISFEMDYSNSIMTGTQIQNNAVVGSYMPSSTATISGGSNNPDALQKAQVFLSGVSDGLSNYMSGGANNSGNNISTQAQNTDLGGYMSPGTAFSKVQYAVNPAFASSTTSVSNIFGGSNNALSSSPG